MEKLDNKDKKIIAFLNKNGRASVSEIARKTGIPRDSVHYRLQRLMKQKWIKFIHPVLDPVKLGYPVFTYVSFHLYNLGEKEEEQFYQFLKNHPQVVYVAKTVGKWDCLIAIAAKDLEHFDTILRVIRKHFSSIIKEYDTASIINEPKYDSMADLVG